jgi:hypothetical protein
VEARDDQRHAAYKDFYSHWMDFFLLRTSKKEIYVPINDSSNELCCVVEEDSFKITTPSLMFVRKVAGMKVHENVAPSAVFHVQKT